MTTYPEWRKVGWSNALNAPYASKKFLRSLTDAELQEYRKYGNGGCVGVNAGRACREMRRRAARRNGIS